MTVGFSWGTTKPPVGSTIDWSHPLSRGLVGCWPLNEGAGSRVNDVAGNYPGTKQLDGKWAAGGGGVAANFDGSADHITTSGLDTVMAGQVQATLIGFVSRSSTSNLVTFGFGATTNARCNILWFTDGNLYCQVENGVTPSFPSIALAGTGRHRIVLTFNGALSPNTARLSLYVDGLQRTLGTNNVATASALSASMGAFSIGREALNNRNTTGQIDFVALYKRALTPAEAVAISATPYAMFAPPVSRRYFIPIAPVSGTIAGTVDAITGSASGSETITGTIAGTVDAVTGSATVAETISGTITGSVGTTTGSATGAETISGSIAGTLGPITGAISESEVISGSISGTLDPITGSLSATVSAAEGQQKWERYRRPKTTRYRRPSAPRFLSADLATSKPRLSLSLTANPAPRELTAWLTASTPTARFSAHVLNPRHVGIGFAAPRARLTTCRQSSVCPTLRVRAMRPSLAIKASHQPDETWLLATLLSESQLAMRAWYAQEQADLLVVAGGR